MKKILLLLLGCLVLSASHGQAISPYLAGQNAWAPKGYGVTSVFSNAGSSYTSELDKLWGFVKQSRVKMIRIGGNGPDFNKPRIDEYVALIDSIRRVGAEPMVQVPYGRGQYTAAQAATIVDSLNNVLHKNIRYWIISNEPNLASALHPQAQSVSEVAAYLKDFSTQMKKKDPSILTVGPECPSYNQDFYKALLSSGSNNVTGLIPNTNKYYLDVISFHYYPLRGTQSRYQVLTKAADFQSNVDSLLALLNSANKSRSASKLRWAVTEFNIDYINPVANTVAGVGVQSFLNGQFWVELFGIGMANNVLTMMPWSIHEAKGARTSRDLGYLDGTGSGVKPRSSFYHEMLVASNLRGTYLPPTVNGSSRNIDSTFTVLSGFHDDTTVVMLLNKSRKVNYSYAVQLSTAAISGSPRYKINVPGGLPAGATAASYTDSTYRQSTLVLLFKRSTGALVKKIVYSLAHADQLVPPSYLAPNQNKVLAAFSASTTSPCFNVDVVNFTASVLGSGDKPHWDFGAGASPRAMDGIGPFAVKYTSTGSKDVSISLPGIPKVTKTAYINVVNCTSPYPGPAAATVPGVVMAVNFDNGGEGVAYHDSTTMPSGNGVRPGEGVETQSPPNYGEGNGNVGYTQSGEWLNYSINVLRSSLYTITVRVAANAMGGSFLLSLNGAAIRDIISVPNTLGFQTYQDIVIPNVYLAASALTSFRCDIVSGGINLEKFTFSEQPMTGIVVNRVYNGAADASGTLDVVELLVVKDSLDARGLIIKDFSSGLTDDAGGWRQLNGSPLWQHLRLGTTIVLRRSPAGTYQEDDDPSDFKLDLDFKNTTYLNNLAPAGQYTNLEETDMVLLKTGIPQGVGNAVHAYAWGSGGSSAFTSATPSGGKLVSSTIARAQDMKYSASVNQSTADFNGTGTKTINNPTVPGWGYGYGGNNTSYIKKLRGIVAPNPSIVVNRIYNGSNDTNGNLDAVELLVVKDSVDLRNRIVKDCHDDNQSDTGGKYQFKDIPFWQYARIGTTIVLRRLAGPSGYVPDYNASDFTLDMLLDNKNYLTNLSTGTNVFNIKQYDMVMLKTDSATGVTGAIHTFATRGGGSKGPSKLFLSVPGPKMTSPPTPDAGAVSFNYPLNPSQTLNDYWQENGAVSTSVQVNWGYGFGSANIAYIKSLRPTTAARVTATRSEAEAAAIGLYPNPAHDSFTLQVPPLAGQSTVRASLINSLGRVVLSRTIGLTAAGATAEINTKSLAAGVYVLRLQSDNHIITKRVVLE